MSPAGFAGIADRVRAAFARLRSRVSAELSFFQFIREDPVHSCRPVDGSGKFPFGWCWDRVAGGSGSALDRADNNANRRIGPILLRRCLWQQLRHPFMGSRMRARFACGGSPCNYRICRRAGEGGRRSSSATCTWGTSTGSDSRGRIAAMARDLNPAIIFLAGDLFDGSRVDPQRRWPRRCRNLSRRWVFTLWAAITRSSAARHISKRRCGPGGIHVLHNESADVEGLRVVGVAYGPSTYPAADALIS